jgi:hypothetical protein
VSAQVTIEAQRSRRRGLDTAQDAIQNRSVAAQIYYSGLPPLSAHSLALAVKMNPFPAQEFRPGPGLVAVLQALVPLQPFAPRHFTLPCWPAVGCELWANAVLLKNSIPTAVAINDPFDIDFFITDLHIAPHGRGTKFITGFLDFQESASALRDRPLKD